MNIKERVEAALDFKVPDAVPAGAYEFWDTFKKRWHKEKNFGNDADPVDYYDFATRQGVPRESPFYLTSKIISDDGKYIVEVDGWGRKKQKAKNGYFYKLIDAVYSDKASLDKLEFDSPDNDDRYTRCIEDIRRYKDKYYTMVKIGGPYLRSSFMRGEENWLMDMVLDEGFTKALLERVTNHLIAVGVNAIKNADVSGIGIMVADDMASNKGPMFSPSYFGKYLLSNYSKIVDKFKQAGAKKVIFHSDGNIAPFLDYLAEAGVDVINPLEPRAMNLAETIKHLKGRIAIMGGICNSVILPSGDRGAIKRHMLELKSLTMEGGLVPYAHSIADDISTDDLEYALDVLRG